MKSLVNKTVSMMMVAVCMMGTAAFADTGSSEVIQIQMCTAEEALGGIPEYIQGPDREDLEHLLNNIDAYNSVGQFDKAKELWETVYAIVNPYKEVYESQHPQEKQMTDEELIQKMIHDLEAKIERFESAGDYALADEVREELDRVLLAVFGEQDPNAGIEPGVGEDPDAQIDPDLQEDPDMQIDPDAQNPEMAPEDVLFIETMEDEIRRLEDMGDFQAADALRAELEAFLNEVFSPDFGGNEEGAFMNSEVLSLEEILSRLDFEVSPEQFEMLEQLVHEINKVALGDLQ